MCKGPATPRSPLLFTQNTSQVCDVQTWLVFCVNNSGLLSVAGPLHIVPRTRQYTLDHVYESTVIVNEQRRVHLHHSLQPTADSRLISDSALGFAVFVVSRNAGALTTNLPLQ